jgi:teichoic acid transport system permease protein
MGIAGKGKKALDLGMNWFRDVYRNRRLILDLANKDFKSRYAASYLGIFWAFVQPVVTIVIYVVVFQFGFRSTAANTSVPYALWLSVGIVPWLFFQEALFQATGGLMEYSYLVKKVVFKISVLPIVKLVSAVYIHIFFAALVVALYLCYGYPPHIYMIQVIYYSAAVTVFVLGVSYITSSLVIFFRDLTQIINIVLQFGMWLTPILWHTSQFQEYMTPFIEKLLKLNPMYYIVSGYRDSLINRMWFWEHPWWTLYFWAVTLGVGVIGTVVFKKLEPHFADVL